MLDNDNSWMTQKSRVLGRLTIRPVPTMMEPLFYIMSFSSHISWTADVSRSALMASGRTPSLPGALQFLRILTAFMISSLLIGLYLTAYFPVCQGGLEGQIMCRWEVHWKLPSTFPVAHLASSVIYHLLTWPVCLQRIFLLIVSYMCCTRSSCHLCLLLAEPMWPAGQLCYSCPFWFFS